MSEFQLDDGIAIPEPLVRAHKYPFEFMRTGQSFFVAHAKPVKMRSAAEGFRKTKPEYKVWKFVIRAVTENKVEGVRVWRDNDYTVDELARNAKIAENLNRRGRPPKISEAA